MKKIIALLVLVIGLAAFTESKANIVITNTQPCAYTVFVFEAVPGSCVLTAQYIPVTVPAFSTVVYTCTPGTWVVGACIQETAPVLMPGCVGLSAPGLGGPCAAYPPGFGPIGSCAAAAVLTVAFPTSALMI